MKEESDISLREVILKLLFIKDIIFSNKIVVISSTLVGALALLAFSIQQKPLYKAKVTFMLEESDKSVGVAFSAYAGIASQLGIMGQAGEYGIDNITQLIKSRRIIADALFTSVPSDTSRVLLVNYYLKVYNLKSKLIKDKPDFEFKQNVKRTIAEEAALGQIIKDVQSKLVVDRVDKKSNILFIEYMDKDPYFSKAVVESALQSLSGFYVSRKTQKAKETLRLVQNRADSIKGELERAEFLLAKLKDVSNRLVKAEGYLNEGRMTRHAQILNVMYTEVVRNLEISKFTLFSQTPLFQIIDQPVLPLDKKVVLSKRNGIILGAFIGFILSSVFVVSRHYLRRGSDK